MKRVKLILKLFQKLLIINIMIKNIPVEIPASIAIAAGFDMAMLNSSNQWITSDGSTIEFAENGGDET